MYKKAPIRVVLADDHALVRQGLLRILEGSRDIEVVGEAADGKRALEVARRLEPDVLLLDYTLPGMDGVLVTEQLRLDRPKVRILILTMHANVHYALKILEAGAHGYLIKAATGNELLVAIRSVHQGKGYVSPTLVPYISRYLGRPSDRSGLDLLSPREFQFLRLVGAGSGLGECAEAMHVTDSTCSKYRTRVMGKLKLENTAELIRFAIENGISG
jgi:two-component system, NarL family, invasion response regulator UvrY